MSARSKTAKKNEEESLTLTVLTMEGDCILDFCLEQDPYDSGYSKTNEVFSVRIDGGPGWLGHKQTYAINDPFQLKGAHEHAQWSKPINTTSDRVVSFHFTLSQV